MRNAAVKPPTAHVVIESSGGVIQDISSDLPIEVLVIDYDEIEEGNSPEVGFPVSLDYKRVMALFDNPCCELNPVYELTLKGYNADTDETDNLIKWVVSPSADALLVFLNRYHVHELLQEAPCLMKGRNMSSLDGVDLVLDDEGNIIIDRGVSIGKGSHYYLEDWVNAVEQAKNSD